MNAIKTSKSELKSGKIKQLLDFKVYILFLLRYAYTCS